MKKTILFLFATAVFFTASAQTTKRKVEYVDGTVTSVNLMDMGRFQQGEETCVDIFGDGIIDQDYTWGMVEVKSDDGYDMTCIVQLSMLPTTRKEGRLYPGCKVSLERIVSGPRYGFPGKGFANGPRTQAGRQIPQGAGAIKGKIISIIG